MESLTTVVFALAQIAWCGVSSMIRDGRIKAGAMAIGLRSSLTTASKVIPLVVSPVPHTIMWSMTAARERNSFSDRTLPPIFLISWAFGLLSAAPPALRREGVERRRSFSWDTSYGEAGLGAI